MLTFRQFVDILTKTLLNILTYFSPEYSRLETKSWMDHLTKKPNRAQTIRKRCVMFLTLFWWRSVVRESQGSIFESDIVKLGFCVKPFRVKSRRGLTLPEIINGDAQTPRHRRQTPRHRRQTHTDTAVRLSRRSRCCQIPLPASRDYFRKCVPDDFRLGKYASKEGSQVNIIQAISTKTLPVT